MNLIHLAFDLAPPGSEKQNSIKTVKEYFRFLAGVNNFYFPSNPGNLIGNNVSLKVKQLTNCCFWKNHILYKKDFSIPGTAVRAITLQRSLSEACILLN